VTGSLYAHFYYLTKYFKDILSPDVRSILFICIRTTVTSSSQKMYRF
jgi:hypothetical protein